MIPTIIISITTFVLVILSILLFPYIKVKRFRLDTYWIIALLGASILLIFNFAPIKNVGEQLVSNAAINPIKILVLFFSMTIISVFLDELGLFKYLASVASSKAKENQFILFFIFYFLTAVLTVFTSNDVVILTLTPFMCFFAKRSRINPIPYLVAEFVSSNTWSLMLMIGNPTNIYLATSAGIDFVSYFKVMAVPTIAAGLVELGILLLLFFKQLRVPLQSNEVTYQIEDKFPVIVGIVHLAVCLVFLVISSYINVEMWLVSLICASSLLVFMIIYSFFNKNNWERIGYTLRRLPYQLIPFFLSMFVIVVALNNQGITTKIAAFLGSNGTIWVYGYSSFLSCNLINNIPMSILFTDLAKTLEGVEFTRAVYASIIGSNIGAFLTPIGALAGIMFTDLVHRNSVRFSFIDFIKYGAIISIPVISVALLMAQLFI